MISLDLETECAKPGCPNPRTCDHALIPHHARITVVAVAQRNPMTGSMHTKVFRDLRNLDNHLLREFPCNPLVGHNLKFDMKMLRHHGVNVPIDRYQDDSALMATASYEKVSPEFLEWYERERKRLNKERKSGHAHREAGQHSLKTCAPFFLGVDPFWEAEDHDNDEYVTKDAVYSLLLAEKMEGMLRKQGTYDFYRSHLMPWSRMFLEAEERGVLLDFDRIDVLEREAKEKIKQIEQELNATWAGVHEAYRQKQLAELKEEYLRMEVTALTKARLKGELPEEKRTRITAKYAGLYEKAAVKIDQKINFNSPVQLKWALKEHLGLDIRGLDGEEATDAEVLELLSVQGRTDVNLLLRYREQHKLIYTYFAAYRDFASPKNTLHATFNLDIARTGRTSCNTPNLQNQPGALHQVFIARPGYKLITLDLEAIEPALIGFFSQDEKLVRLIQEGLKFHSFNAQAIFDQPSWDVRKLKKEHPAEYDAAKEFGLSVLYGAGKNRVKMSSVKRGFNWPTEQCSRVVRALRENWPGVTAYKETIDESAKQGCPVETIMGRLRIFTDPDEVYLKAFNGQAQGSGSDLCIESVYDTTQVYKRLGLDAHFLMSIHDEGVIEARADHAEQAYQIAVQEFTKWYLPTALGPVPIRVEGKISDRWEK